MAEIGTVGRQPINKDGYVHNFFLKFIIAPR